MTLTANGFISQKFDIGLGYDPSKFEVCTDNSVGIVSVIKGSIKYNGPCPHAGRPSVCQICPGVPTPPVITSSATAITSTQSKLLVPHLLQVLLLLVLPVVNLSLLLFLLALLLLQLLQMDLTLPHSSLLLLKPLRLLLSLLVLTMLVIQQLLQLVLLSSHLLLDVKTVVTTYCPLTQTVTLVLPVPRLSIWVAQPVTLVTTGTLVRC